MDSTNSDLLRPGDVLGDTFVVRRKLGEGGMGQVFEAFDRSLGRRVAVKVARPGLSVTAEARAMAALRGHPSMVTLYALGLHEDLEYAVMEIIDGVTLERRLDALRAERARLDIDEIASLGAAMADGLAFVHAAGVAHRDVKPPNIILAPNHRVVITDFGIFRPEYDQTRAAFVEGTPDYMAPEALGGHVAQGELFLVDVYSLGVVLFEMLTGEPPFRSLCPRTVMMMHLRDPAPDPTTMRPDTPRRMADLVGRMMAKAPTARPGSMQEVAWTLRHLHRGREVLRSGVYPPIRNVQELVAIRS